MKFELIKKMGSVEIKLSGECNDQMNFFRAASFVSDLPDSCGNCQSKNLRFLYRNPKGYEYAEVLCNDCRHTLKYGQHKEGNTLFAKGWEPPYVLDQPNEEKEQHAPRKPEPVQPQRKGW